MQEKTMNSTENVTTLCVDDGLERIVINNKFGDELGVFYFRPADTGIIDRYNESLAMIEKAVEPLQRHELDIESDDTEAAATAILAALNAAKVELYKAFDYLFDANVAEAFFTKVNPFTLTGGRFYCEAVLEAVGAYIAKRIGAEVNKLNKRTARYTHGYRTGKHKDGKK